MKNRPFNDISDLPFDKHDGVSEEVTAYRKKHEMRTAGGCIDPWLSYAACPLPQALLQSFSRAGYTTPSVIQAQAWPNCMSGRDVVGVAKTGSGKTLGFLVPAFVKIMSEPRGNIHQGPVSLVLAPTRELACQIREEVVKFGQNIGVQSCCVYGGAPKGPQLRDLRNGVHIVIATPGRLNDFLEQGLIRLGAVSYMVFDEADRMLDMGFEPQIRKIVAHIPQTRQTMFFTATWPREVRRLASEFLSSPVIVYIGDTDNLQANPDVDQVVHVVDDMRQKEQLLQQTLRQMGQGALIIIFAGTKRMCDQLERNLGRFVRCSAIHGDKDQQSRTRTLENFKRGITPVMIATDVAARGVDVKEVKCVVNFDFPQSVEDYVHRIGRTGRAGAKGSAVTFITSKDARKAGHLIKVMEGAGQVVSEDLRRLAGGSFQGGSSMRFGGGGGGFGGGGGGGFGGGGSFGGGGRSFGGGGGGGFGGGRDGGGGRGRDRSPPRRRRSPSRSRSRGRRRRSPSSSRSRSRGRRRSRSRSRDRRRRSPSRSRSRDRRGSRARKSSRSRSPPKEGGGDRWSAKKSTSRSPPRKKFSEEAEKEPQ